MTQPHQPLLIPHSFSQRTVVAVAVTAALMSPTVVFAEPTASGDPAAQETMTVLGQTYRHTATKTALAPEETPQSITVLESDTLELRGVNSVSEALRYVPGVNTEVRGGGVKIFDTFNIRGFDVTQSYYDGLALQYLVGWNLQPQIDPVAIEQVEVFKGPTSVLYGTMPPGGMVNIIPKSPQQTRATTVSVSTGTNNLKEAAIDTTGQIGDSDFAYRLIALGSDKDGQARGTEEERYLIAPSLDWAISDQTLVNFNLYYQRDPESGINSAAPSAGSVYASPNGDLPADLFVGDENWNTLDREVLMVGYKVNHDFNNDWTLLHHARYMDASLHQENTYNVGFAAGSDTLLNRNAYLTEESSKGLVIDTQLTGVIATGSVRHNVLFGLDYQQLDADVLYQDYGAIAPIDVFNPNTNQVNPGSFTDTPYTNDKQIEVEQIGGYLQDQVRLDRLVLIAGGRYDYYKTTSQEQVGVSDYDIDISQHNFSYRVGALYELNSGFSPFFSFATSFEPIGGSDKNGKSFDPSTGEQWEAGVKYQSADMTTTASLAAFHITKKNALTADREEPLFKTQTGEIVSQGIELEGKIYPTDNIDVTFNYTLMDMEITQDNSGLEGKTPVWVAEQTGSLWANYHIYDGALAGALLGTGVRYVGETQLDAMNSDTVPSYTLVDLAMRYDLGELSRSLSGVSAQLTATNLFDKEYYSCYDANNCWFGAEQTVEAKVSYSF